MKSWDMNTRNLRILVIDDDQDDCFHIKDLLNDVNNSKYTVSWESTYAGGVKALCEKDFDACLLDYKLGEKTGLDLLIEAQQRAFSFPIIFLTGLVDFELDMQAMQLGAADFLVKGQLTSPLLERSIRYSIKQAIDLEELKKTKAQVLQQDRLASLGLLASSLAHEIGTPLGIIRSRAELAAKKSEGNPNVNENVQAVISQIDRITKLVQSLLHLARGGKAQYATAIDLNFVIQDVLTLLEHEFGRKNIELIKDITPDCLVKAEAGPLGQVLLNLLINSIHAIEAARVNNSERPSQVFLKVRDMNSTVEISVRDTGIGISQENQRELFKPFFTTKEIGHGTGLGLATSYSIIQSWGGNITVQSQFGEGSTFTVKIPKPK